MKENLVILGRQPALGLAELESLYGAAATAVGSATALVSAEVDFGRLGGAIKRCTLIGTLSTVEWRDIENFLLKAVGGLAGDDEGKLRLGVSAYGFSVKPPQVEALGLSLKKALKKSGRSVRLVPNKTADLSSAQVFHNRLAEHNGLELIIVRDGDKVFFGRTTAVQDINAYTLRDRGRPKRDARVGMLPPKLAQIIINLSQDAYNTASPLWDPFCGTGVILQEASLMGIATYGSDIDKRMIDYTRTNLEWLSGIGGDRDVRYHLTIGDATTIRLEPQPKISRIASETYLGKPFTSLPAAEILARTVSECDLIIQKFLRNVHGQLPKGARLCLAVPAWQVRPGQFRQLPLIDRISDMGYNRVKFEQVRDDQLLYYRADQIVARELLVLTRI